MYYTPSSAPLPPSGSHEVNFDISSDPFLIQACGDFTQSTQNSMFFDRFEGGSLGGMFPSLGL